MGTCNLYEIRSHDPLYAGADPNNVVQAAVDLKDDSLMVEQPILDNGKVAPILVKWNCGSKLAPPDYEYGRRPPTTNSRGPPRDQSERLVWIDHGFCAIRDYWMNRGTNHWIHFSFPDWKITHEMAENTWYPLLILPKTPEKQMFIGQ